mgnify:CR=1 FL=1
MEKNVVIISKDKDYDNIVEFWKEKGYIHIARKAKLPCNNVQKQNKITSATSQSQSSNVTINSRTSAGLWDKLDGEGRSKLNSFMQHELVAIGYDRNVTNTICKYVVSHCNDDKMLNGIHNDLKKAFYNGSEVYKDVKVILEKFLKSGSKLKKRELQVRSFFGQHFKKKIYVDHKEEIIHIILEADTKQQVNNELLKLYSDGTVVSHIYKTVQPLIGDLPGK